MQLDKKGRKAIFNLIFHFNLHLFYRVFPFLRRGKFDLKSFRENYKDDYIIELSSLERSRFAEFSKCINCGLCSSQCPVLRSLKKDNFLGPGSIAISLSRSLPELWATKDVIYNCLNCVACNVVCPQGVPIDEIVSFVRGKIFQEGINFLPDAYQEIISNIKELGNIYGERKADFSIYEKEKAEYVFFVGCVSAYKERESIERTLSLLKHLKVSFTTIDEVCCGRFYKIGGADLSVCLPSPGEKQSCCHLPTSTGQAGKVRDVVGENINKVMEKGTNKIITTCPECYLTFRNNPDYQKELEVEHITQFLSKIEIKIKTDKRITYHDPCDLGRLSGIYEEPRSLIKKFAPNFVEMENSRELSACCGSREGGRIIDEEIILSVSKRRIKEAEDVGAEVLLTSCPSCLHNLKKAISKEQKIKVYNISEYMGGIYGNFKTRA